MTELFRTVLNMSITGAYIAAAIIILRLFMKKLPKKYSYMLWAILGIRLLCPFSFSSTVSLFNVLIPEKPEISSGQMEYIPSDIEYSYEPKVTVSVPPVNETVNTYLPPAEPNNSANPMQIVMSISAIVWLVGMAAMVIYTVLSYISVRKRVKGAKEQNGIFICDNIETPFVFGIIKPRIYLPENISDDDMRYIIAHEQAHIRRGDHIVKLIAMAVLCVHWFDPMVWISYRLMTKDMELSCDEKALGTFDADVKKAYANALLNISLKQNKLALGGVLSFGESDIKSRIKGVLGAKKPKIIVTVIAVIALMIAAVCLLTNAVKKDKEFASISDGVYVTDKLLYTVPYKDSYWGDDNGLSYEIKGSSLIITNLRGGDGEASSFTLSEPMEIPFTEEEWSEAFDDFEKTGWQDGEKNLGDYDNKYCYSLQSDEDGGLEHYLFVMDDELWYVTYGLEIYRLKSADGEIQGKSYTYVSPVTDLETALKFERVTGNDPLCMNITIPYDAKIEEDFVRFSANTVMKISPFVESPVDMMNIDTELTGTINDMSYTCSVIMRSPVCHEYNIIDNNDNNGMRWLCFITEHNNSYSNIILFVTTDDEFTYEKAEKIVSTVQFMMYYDFSDETDEEEITQPTDAARKYLNGKNITDENISELRVAQYSFFNEAWKYTLPPLSLKYGVNEGDNVVEVIATYKIDVNEVHTIIITSVNETGFRVLDEVNYLPREFTAVISEVHGNEDVTGYEWQKYVIIPDEDSYGFTKGEKTLVFSRPYYGNDFLNVGDKVRVKYSGEPVTSFTLVEFEQPAYYFLHMTSLQEDIAAETQSDESNETTAEKAENAFQTVSRKQRPMIPDEYGGYNIDQNSELIDVSFAVPAKWSSDGHGIFMMDDKKVLEQNIIYSDSCGLMTEGFLVDMVSGREVKIIDARYGGENDPWVYYIHTIITDSYYGDFDYHHLVVHSGEYYVQFSFNDSEDFNMAIAESVLESVSISYVGTPVIPEYDTNSDEAFSAEFSLCASYLTEYINASFGMGDFNARKYTNNKSFAEYVDSKYAYERYLRTDDSLTKLLIHDDDIDSGIKSNGTKWLAFNYEVSFIYAMSSEESGYGRMAYFEYSEEENGNINIISVVDFGPFDARYIGLQETMGEPPYEVDFSTAIVDVS